METVLQDIFALVAQILRLLRQGYVLRDTNVQLAVLHLPPVHCLSIKMSRGKQFVRLAWQGINVPPHQHQHVQPDIIV